MLQLRPYQQNVKNAIYTAWANGLQNVLVQMDTGSGKTVLFSSIIADDPYNCIVIAHRIELVSQISLTLAKQNVRHNLIAQRSAIKNIIALHMFELNKSFYDPQASCYVAGVDTLIKLNSNDHMWFKKIKLIVQDEAHHILKNNKWGKAAALFPNARSLNPTATPIRADGKGLGRHADGIIDTIITGPAMRDLINAGYLTDYQIIAPPSNLDLSNVSISASGDFSPPQLRNAVHRSCIMGDVVSHYLKFARGKLGVTFAVDIKAASDIAEGFRQAGISAEIITSKTPDLLRAQIMQRFRNREILMLVNVDLLGEGVDVPAIEVVIMARPTQSYSLYSQQFGRALRPMPGKDKAIIIDHVGNVMRHKLPDSPRVWSLDRRESRRAKNDDLITPIRICTNKTCLSVYERYLSKCPYCDYKPIPVERSSPEHVDGDLTLLSDDVLKQLRGEVEKINGPARIPQHLNDIAQRGIANRHHARQQIHNDLRNAIALYAGFYKQQQRDDSEIYKRFYLQFGVDVLTAQTLNTNQADELNNKILNYLNTQGVKAA